jgi:hypothetical protein
MPIGIKRDPEGGAPIDFDSIFAEAIEPAIRDAGLVPHRDDHDVAGGIMQRRIFQSLLLCEYAVADLTISNANVYYELGIRHAVRPYTTMTLTARPERMPFDVRYLRSLRYGLDPANRLMDPDALRQEILGHLRRLRDESHHREPPADSPLFQLLTEWVQPSLASLKTDRFNEEVRFSEQLKERLAGLRHASTQGREATEAARREAATIADELAAADAPDPAVLVELMLTLRALEDWDAMVHLIESMPAFLRSRVLVQEQLAFALNRRAGDRGEAERDRAVRILEGVEEAQGGTSAETSGLLGRIHKDRWLARRAADPELAVTHLEDAIAAYRRGFLADPRDPYPGINAVLLLDVRGAQRDRDRLLPVVRFAAERLVELGQANYWIHATLLTLAVLERDEAEARRLLGRARADIRERWEPATTARDLRMLAEAWEARGDDASWIRDLAARLSPQ